MVEVILVVATFEEKTDTIVACATPPGKGAIAIIRLSGKNTLTIIKAIIKSNESVDEWRSRTLVHGFVVDSNRRPLDEVLCSVMNAPRSYTGEDVAEIYCHGGEGIIRTLLELAIENGARLAHPGEFTRRAYENGKLDITKAQVVQQLIEAHTREELYGSCRVLTGELAQHLRKIAEKTEETLAVIEAAIDFSEEQDVHENLAPSLKKLSTQLERLVSLSRRKADQTAEVVVAGRINVGKSSIVNKLCDRKVSIVTSDPGTTRDAVEVETTFGGLRVKLVDTAGQGLGSLNCKAEFEAQAVAASKVQRANIVLWVGTDIVQMLNEAPPKEKNRDVVLVVNKIDLLSSNERDRCIEHVAKVDGLMISALTGEGFDRLIDALTKKLLVQVGPADGIPISIWQEEGIDNTRDSILKATDRIKDNDLELAAEDLNRALDQTNMLLGENAGDDILDRIFERFCIGK
jgi:tRNA modification GTPase